MVYLLTWIEKLLQAIQPVLVPLCLIVTWTMLLLMGWGVWAAIRDGVSNAKRMHDIPCANCRFFTHDYLLKCPVHPTKALSEDAIGCPDHDGISGAPYAGHWSDRDG